MDKKGFQRRRRNVFIVAPASARTWVVAFSRRLIPGALFSSRAAAVRYARVLAATAGLGGERVHVLD